MKILILEDEPLVAESLRKQVLAIEPTSTILGPIATVSEAGELLAKEMPDLILSDIQLADGISLDLFAEKKIYCPVIFTTAYDEYAMRAFKINSIDYLLKPIDKHELKAAFDQFRNLLDIFGKEPYQKHLNEQFAGFRNTAKYKERFSVHHGRNIVPLSVDEVAFF